MMLLSATDVCRMCRDRLLRYRLMSEPGLDTFGYKLRVDQNFGPAPASKKLMARLGFSQTDFDVIKLDEAFASQGLATLRDLGIALHHSPIRPAGNDIAFDLRAPNIASVGFPAQFSRSARYRRRDIRMCKPVTVGTGTLGQNGCAKGCELASEPIRTRSFDQSARSKRTQNASNANDPVPGPLGSSG